MRTSKEMADLVFQIRDEHLEKKNRFRIIKLAAPAVACFGLAIAFGIGYYAKFAKMPEIPVAPPVAEVSIAETTTTMVSSLTDSSTVSPSDTPKSKNTNKKTIPTTVSGHEEQTEQPPSYEVYPPRLTVTTALNTSSGSKTVHTTVSHRVTEKVSTVTTAEQTSKRTTTVVTTAPLVIESTVTSIHEQPIAKKTVKEYRVLHSMVSTFDYGSLLAKSYTEFTCNNNDIEEPSDIALKEVEKNEALNGGIYPRRRAGILGYISSDAERLTYDKVLELLNDPDIIMSETYLYRIRQAIEETIPYPDFICEGENDFTEYWLNSTGTEKIVLIPKMDAVVYAVLDD